MHLQPKHSMSQAARRKVQQTAIACAASAVRSPLTTSTNVAIRTCRRTATTARHSATAHACMLRCYLYKCRPTDDQLAGHVLSRGVQSKRVKRQLVR
jgi:hypothetical protein